MTAELIRLTPADLALAAALMLILGGLSWRLDLSMSRPMLIAAARATVQLLLLGLVLDRLFASSAPWLIALIAFVMFAVAGYEVMARQRRRLKGLWGYGTGAAAMFFSAFIVNTLTLTVIIQPAPWYQPQYLIPLLGMLLGNSMTGISVALDTLTRTAWDNRTQVEARLMLGHTADEAIADIRRESLRAGLIPIINALTTAGIVSLPGMMTGQILAGSPPLEAAKYQLLILFLIAVATGLGAAIAVFMASRRLFDERERLRLDRLAPARR